MRTAESGRDDFQQFEVKRHEFEAVVQLQVREASHMALLKLRGAGESLAAPDFFRNSPEFDGVYLGGPDEAAQPLLQVVETSMTSPGS
jgi:hypothetical protein